MKFDDYKLFSTTDWEVGMILELFQMHSLKVGLSSFVDLTVSFNLRYDAKPPETIKTTDTITKFGFSFNF